MHMSKIPLAFGAQITHQSRILQNCERTAHGTRGAPMTDEARIFAGDQLAVFESAAVEKSNGYPAKSLVTNLLLFKSPGERLASMPDLPCDCEPYTAPDADPA